MRELHIGESGGGKAGVFIYDSLYSSGVCRFGNQYISYSRAPYLFIRANKEIVQIEY